ncbi:hypothetical protein ACQBAU_07325 [Propionibacteriaceae bacterium Y2011]|uniref:hypothetical protein n=1 Tax=Microlunatus sp. Y2014 TaxID=3418488 RepID=UPI003D3A866E
MRGFIVDAARRQAERSLAGSMEGHTAVVMSAQGDAGFWARVRDKLIRILREDGFRRRRGDRHRAHRHPPSGPELQRVTATSTRATSNVSTSSLRLSGSTSSCRRSERLLELADGGCTDVKVGLQPPLDEQIDAVETAAPQPDRAAGAIERGAGPRRRMPGQ